METLDKQQLIKTAAEATAEMMKCRINLAQSSELLKEMVDSQCQFQHEMDICNTTVKVLLLHAHNLINGENPQHGMEPEAAQAIIEVLGYQKVTDGEPM